MAPHITHLENGFFLESIEISQMKGRWRYQTYNFFSQEIRAALRNWMKFRPTSLMSHRPMGAGD